MVRFVSRSKFSVGSLALLICFLTLASLAPAPVGAATAYRVADLSNVRRGISSNPEALGHVGNRALFTSSRGGLIVSNGTNAGTQEFLVGNAFESLGEAGARHYLWQVEFEVISGQFTSLAQPWITDGTAAGTFALSTTRGPWDQSRARLFATVPGTSRAFFAFDDGVHGEELWVSDGTRAGTHLVADLVAGSGSSFPSTGLWLANAGRFVFTAFDLTLGWRLWITDGTSAETRELRNFGPNRPQLILGRDGHVVLLARVGEQALTLWTSDGTSAGTVQVAQTPSWSTISRSVVAGGRFYFFGRDPQTDDDELWVTDGTAQGTARLTDIAEPRPILHRGEFQAVATDRGIAFFAFDDSKGHELWVSDGTAAGTRVAFDACPGLCDGVDAFFTPSPTFHRGRLYWSAADDSAAGVELLVSDALGGGVERLGNLCAGPCSQPFREMTTAGPRVYFIAIAGGRRSLLRTSGTAASTARLTDFDDSFFFSEAQFLAVGGNLLFANSRGATGAELWVSNGRANGTRLLRDLAPGDFGGSMPRSFMASANRAFFIADDGVRGSNQLWTSDGTATGTRFVANLPEPEFGSFSISSWKAAGNRVVFLLNQALWASDGTAAGTRSLLPANVEVRSFQLTSIGFRVYFVATQDFTSSAPWVTDGTVAGTRRLAVPEPLFSNSGTFLGTPSGDVLFTESSEGGGFPWFVLSPAGGPARPLGAVYPFLNDKIAGGILGEPVAIGNKLYFALESPSDTFQLWEFDFTARRARSVGVSDDLENSINFARHSTDGRRVWVHLLLSSGQAFWRWNGGSSVVIERIDDPVNPVGAIGGKFYGQTILDPTLGSSVVVGDGSVSGSVPVRDASGEAFVTRTTDRVGIAPLGPRSAVCVTPNEVWITDGTAARTTRLLQFEFPIFSGGNPAELVSVGGRVFFRGWDLEAGFELWAVRGDANAIE